MKKTRNLWRVALLLAVFALVAAACSSDSDDTTTTEGGDTTTTAAETTTTAGETTTTAATETTAAAMDYGDPVTITLGHPFPEQHPIHQGVMVPYAEAVNEATNGAVTIEIHPGGALAAAPATFDNTVVGGQDMGWALQGYHAGVFPVTEVVEQPFQFTSALQATQTLWDLYDAYPELQEEYEEVQPLMLWTHDVGDFWTGNKEVTVIGDLAGLNLRFPTRMMGRFIEEAGGSPVGMPAPAIFDALSTGVIDGLSIAVSGLQSFQLYPELQYGAQCDCYVGAQYLVMNQSTWDSLTPDTQAVMLELGREYSVTAGEVYDAAYVAVGERALEEGIQIYVLPEDELANWHAVGATVTADWIAEQEADGIPAQEMYDMMQEIKAQYAN